LFAVYAAMSLVPVLLLGVILLDVLNAQADSRGLAEGRAEANLIARVGIAPALDGADLRRGLQPAEQAALTRTVALAIHDGDVLRLRLRDLGGNVVFSDDRSSGGPDEESLDAATGQTVSELTYLNADQNDTGPRGPRVVEVYQPLTSVQTGARIGVLEMYVPYAPIAAEISHGQHVVALTLGGGLAVLWLCLLLVTASVTDRLRRQAKLNAFLAAHDVLTGLPNRAQFTTLASTVIGRTEPSLPTAVALIDLDRFKDVNDTLGHAIGDQLLVVVAERLRGQLRPGDTLARLGGDEFAVVLADLHGAGEAVERLNQLRASIAEPIRLEGLPLTVEASIGFALAPEDGADADQLLQRADIALYVAKRKYLGVAHYRRAYEVYDASTLTLVAELGRALEREELRLHYQPKGDVRSGCISSVEALVRWEHPTRGLLYPDAFVPAAEQTELIDQLTRWVLRTALAALPGLDPTGRLSVAINISARNLIHTEFADEVLGLINAAGISPDRVILELTETALLADPERATRTLVRLHEAGLRVSIDDFGAGQTSLSYLVGLPINELKIDKAFVLSMLADAGHAAIVRSVIDLGHSLGFTVTAEGVETIEALEWLTRQGCDVVQGYLLARPVPPSNLPESLGAATTVLISNNQRPVAITSTPDLSALQ
jgi:diguanylate cyclase (GGDEF)-like protein